LKRIQHTRCVIKFRSPGALLFITDKTPSSQYTNRPSHLKIPGGPKMARVALSRRAIDGPNVSKLTWYTAQQADACLPFGF